MFLSYQVAASVAEGRLRYLLRAFEPERVPIHVVYPSARLRSRTVTAFVEHATSRLRDTRFD
jgi:DNA-binding transcriptional LysR family regulator